MPPPQTPPEPADERSPRAFTASEVLLLEMLKVCERRGWRAYAQYLIDERARSHFEVLSLWASKLDSVPQDSDDVLQDALHSPDNDAQDRRPLAERVEDARRSAAQRHPSPPAPANESFADMGARALQMLDQHHARLVTLPDLLREAVDHDLSADHRRVVLTGRVSASRGTPPANAEELYPLHRHALVGLALSGGGVRSASFALGAMLAMSRIGLLRCFDHVSAVSGGGWAAGWLAAWSYRHPRGVKGVEDALFDSFPADTAPLRWVRRHITYLAPRPGMASGDSWQLLTAYIANWLPILMLVLLFALTVMLVPHALSTWVNAAQEADRNGWVLAASLATLWLMTLLRRLTLFYRSPGARARPAQGLRMLVMASTLVTTLLLAAALPFYDPWIRWIAARLPTQQLDHHGLLGHWLIASAFWTALALVAAAFAVALASARGQRLVDRWRRWRNYTSTRSGQLLRHATPVRREVLALTVSAVVSAGLVMLCWPLVMAASASAALRLSVGPPLLLAVFALAEILGAMVVVREDVDRAWLARLGGWMLAPLMAWSALCAVALGASKLWRVEALRGYAVASAVVLAALVLVSIWRILRGTRERNHAFGVAATAALLVALLPLGVAFLARRVDGDLHAVGTVFAHLLVTGVLLGLVALTCNVNRFSFHPVYKQGLARTFLGASRRSMRNTEVMAHPEPDGRTGEAPQFELRKPRTPIDIDPLDSPPLAWLQSRPEHELPVLLLNAAVNGVSLTDRQGRAPHQWPFTFSQYFTGSAAAGIGYAPTGEFYKEAGGHGVTLAGAMAVSGAAVSPTAGSATRALKALVLGVLNARLGMWIGNPHHPEAVRKASPALAGFTVLKEMFGLRARFGKWIHLSDGGHFENLGVYELVRRGCLRIVAIDASCDPDREFGDLAETIRRVRIDLGVNIHAHHDPKMTAQFGMAPADKPDLGNRGWLWFDIEYGHGVTGRLLYLKPTVYQHRSLALEVLSYWRQSREFPHESTLNQFFSERQMHAYYALGHSTMADALAGITGASGRDDVDGQWHKLLLRSN